MSLLNMTKTPKTTTKTSAPETRTGYLTDKREYKDDMPAAPQPAKELDIDENFVDEMGRSVTRIRKVKPTEAAQIIESGDEAWTLPLAIEEIERLRQVTGAPDGKPYCKVCKVISGLEQSELERVKRLPTHDEWSALSEEDQAQPAKAAQDQNAVNVSERADRERFHGRSIKTIAHKSDLMPILEAERENVAAYRNMMLSSELQGYVELEEYIRLRDITAAELERVKASEARLLSELKGMLDVYGELHARYDLGECQATIDARATIARAEGRAS